jgi:hypothetical protein
MNRQNAGRSGRSTGRAGSSDGRSGGSGSRAGGDGSRAAKAPAAEWRGLEALEPRLLLSGSVPPAAFVADLLPQTPLVRADLAPSLGALAGGASGTGLNLAPGGSVGLNLATSSSIATTGAAQRIMSPNVAGFVDLAGTLGPT